MSFDHGVSNQGPGRSVVADAAVEFNGVTVVYPQGVGIEDVTFTLRSGEFLAIVGPNGSGKTTLLRCILGLVKPARGRVEVLGVSGPASCGIGYVPQRRPFDPAFPASALDVVMMGTYGPRGLLRPPTAKDREQAKAGLAAVGLAALAGHTAGHLSGGQQQRLLIAQALVRQPRLLLLDEPTSGVDVATRRAIVELICRLHAERHLTTLYVTHDINEVLSCVDKVLCINHTVCGFGTVAEVLEPATLEGLYGSKVVLVKEKGQCYVVTGDSHA